MRRYPVVLTASAKADVKGIARWYRRQRPGHDRAFRSALGATLRSIGAMPETRQVIHSDARRATIEGFPHGVFYRLTPDQVVVFAVKHPSQHPSSWQSRM